MVHAAPVASLRLEGADAFTPRPTSLTEQFDVGDAGATVPSTRADDDTSVVVSGGSSVRASSKASDTGLNTGGIEDGVDEAATSNMTEESSSLLRGAQSDGASASRPSMLVGLGASARAVAGLRRVGAGPVGLQPALGVAADDVRSSGSGIGYSSSP